MLSTTLCGRQALVCDLRSRQPLGGCVGTDPAMAWALSESLDTGSWRPSGTRTGSQRRAPCDLSRG